MDYDALLNTATQIGYMLLANGAEIYRVEESMNRVLHAYGVMDCGVFVVPSSIMVSVTTGQGHTVSKIKRVYTHATNLAKVERVNDLCRRTCRGQMEIMAAGSGKRAGAQQLARLLHIPRENVMACGDHYNDVGMIEWAGIGVAMGNAQPRVKQLADYVAPRTLDRRGENLGNR